MSLTTFTTLQTMDYAGPTGPFVSGATKGTDLTTMDVPSLTGPFVANPDITVSTGTGAITQPHPLVVAAVGNVTSTGTAAITMPHPLVVAGVGFVRAVPDLPRKTPGVPQVPYSQTKSPWLARSEFEDAEKKKQQLQLLAEAEHAQAVDAAQQAIAQAEAEAARIKDLKTAKVNDFIDALFAPQPKVLTPEERARQAEEAKAIKARADVLLQQYEQEQRLLAFRIERDTKAREEQRKADIIAKVKSLRSELEFERAKKQALEDDDQVILKLVQEMETSEA